jgi:hypothetical protein
MFTAGGARARIHGLALCLLVAAASAALGGCNNSGSYRLDWQFRTQPVLTSDSTSPTFFQTGDCGLAGVSGIQIGAAHADGSGAVVVQVPCGVGFYDGGLDAGSWTFDLLGLDANGMPKDPSNAALHGQTTSLVEIHAGEKAGPIPAIYLQPLPQCQDGVDNDLDGRVDLDDADCADASGTSECGATDGPSCDDHALL